ncbi:MFS general substrate transporter [Stipitochalara longipes BDJ]|nr:MFS general substrate transporter [Stipitochalara longipes BDJ]
MVALYNDNDEPASETSPLVADGSESRDAPESATTQGPHPHPKFLRVAAIVIVAVFFIEVASYMTKAPLMRLLEDVICRSYYESTEPPTIDLSIPIPEGDCKSPWIQSKLAMLRGWDTVISCIPGLLLSVPYGVLADKRGRKFVLILALGGVLLGLLWALIVIWFSDVLDIRWYLFSNVFLIIGGGSPVLRAMFFAILSDVTPEDRRTRVFSLAYAASLISTLVAIPLSWSLMKINVWIPMFVIVGLFNLGLLLCLFLPETLERSKIPAPSTESGHFPEHHQSIQSRITQVFENIRDSLSIFESYLIFGLSFTFLLQTLHGYSVDILFQLASERFHWTLAEASFLFPISSVTTCIGLVVALPAVYHVLSTRYEMSTMAKDLLVARGSLIIYIIGALAVALGAIPSFFVIGTMIYACGAGFSAAIRSLVTSLVHPDEVSRLYTVLAVIETVGQIAYGVLLPLALGWGLHLGGLWKGIPFLICAALFAVIGLPIWLVKEPTPEMDIHG